MKTLDLYILKELIRPTLFGLFIFGSLWMVNLLIQTVHLFVTKGVAFTAVAQIFLYSMPTILVTAAPMASLLGALLAMGRLNADSEIIAAKGCGISYLRMMLPVFAMGFLISLASFWFNDWVVPYANGRQQEVFTNEVILKKPLPRVAKDIFFDGGGSFRMFVRSYSPETEEMQDITSYQFEKTNYPQVTEARRAKLGQGIWTFEDGVTYVYRADGSLDQELRFGRWVYPFKTKHGEDIVGGPKAPKEMSFRELLEHIRTRRAQGMPTRHEEVDLWFKTAFPFANLFLVLVGTPLAARNLRGSGSGIGYSILLMFLYYVLLAIGRALGDGGTISPVVGAWAPNLAMAIAAAFLMVGASR